MIFNLKVLGDSIENGDLISLYGYTFINGKKFPKSYVDFVANYGYGLTCDLFLIFIPMKDHSDSFFVRSEEIIGTYQDVLDDEDELWFDLEPDVSYVRLKNLIPFAMSENGHYLFWDLESNSPDEFDIYITDFKGLGFTKVADNLNDFLDKVTSEDQFRKVLPNSSQPLSANFKTL